MFDGSYYVLGPMYCIHISYGSALKKKKNKTIDCCYNKKNAKMIFFFPWWIIKGIWSSCKQIQLNNYVMGNQISSHSCSEVDLMVYVCLCHNMLLKTCWKRHTHLQFIWQLSHKVLTCHISWDALMQTDILATECTDVVSKITLSCLCVGTRHRLPTL